MRVVRASFQVPVVAAARHPILGLTGRFVVGNLPPLDYRHLSRITRQSCVAHQLSDHTFDRTPDPVRLLRMTPPRTRTTPARIATVTASLRTAHPRITATIGSRYVTTDAAVGPSSWMIR